MFAAEIKPALAPLPREAKPKLPMPEISGETEYFLKAVAARLMAQTQKFEPAIAEYARYALAAQGKQLRPLLVALSAQAAGKLKDEHVTIATIIEMVHLATLVHDDVIDEASVRRGRPTVTANWGNEISVLLGDCLFACAVELSASFPTPEVCRAVSGATHTVCSGEILQSRQRGNFQLTRQEYFRVVSMKTGELFALSCDLGAAVANATDVHRNALREFGMALGTAYQVYDDCIDLFGSERNAGKSLGSDLAKGKLTLPLLVFLERADDFDRSELQRMVAGWTPEFLPRVLELVEKYNVLAECSGIIDKYLTCAREHLSLLPLSASRIALNDFSEYLGCQTAALEAVS